MEPIRTERLILRRPSAEDLGAFLAYRNSPQSMSLQPIKPMEEEAAARFLESQAAIDPERATGWIMFSVELISEKRMIGEVGIYIPPDKNQGEMGWSISPDFQGRGFATEAARRLLPFAFNTRKLHRISATCDARNTASIRLMARLGMRSEAKFIQSNLKNDEWQDECVYAILRKEWLAIR